MDRTAQSFDPSEPPELQLHFYHLGKRAASLIHALSTPLTTIFFDLESLNAQLASHQLSPHCHDCLERLTYSSAQIRSLLYPNPLSLDETLPFQLNLPHMVKQLFVYYRATEPEIAFSLKISDQPNNLFGPKAVLYQILDTLIRNATQSFSLEYSKSPQVQVVIQSFEDKLKIVVRDNGRGMTKQQLTHLFIPQKRPPKNQPNRHGLGLLLAKQLLKTEFNGELQITSQVGVGTTVTMSIPTRGN